jgi:hypothetical protein
VRIFHMPAARNDVLVPSLSVVLGMYGAFAQVLVDRSDDAASKMLVLQTSFMAKHTYLADGSSEGQAHLQVSPSCPPPTPPTPPTPTPPPPPLSLFTRNRS